LAFLQKFCFPTAKNSDVGQLLNYTFKSKNNLRIMLYLLDPPNPKIQGHGWSEIYPLWKNDKISCENMTERYLWSDIVKYGIPGQYNPRSFQIPYFWYVAVSDCNSKVGLDIESYEMTFVNREYGTYEYQFSYDTWGVAQAHLAFIFFYIALVGLHLYGSWQLFRVEAYHPLVKILTASVFTQAFANFLQVVHTSIYVGNGIGAPAIAAIGELLTMTSQLFLMFLCILIAKGWAITTNYLSQKNIILIVMSLFVIGFLILFIWSNFGIDPALTIYFYESPPGIIVLILRCLLVIWFLYCLRDTLRLENLPERRQFYMVFSIAYSVWFIALPLVVLILSFVDPWVRYRIVRILSLSIDYVGLGALAFLLWPSRAQNYFTIRSTAQLLDHKGNEKYDL